MINWSRVLWIAAFTWFYLNGQWVIERMTTKPCNYRVIASCEP